ncbi:MAG TPA: Fic family protein [Anaeromyxobacteraceae bacterium]|nr:Fic family protein [Anaeromyxobacteraceae bacterium]
MRSRYLDIEDRTQDLAEALRHTPAIAQEFSRMFELSWIHHENALEGLVFTGQEIAQALEFQPVAEASSLNAYRDVRNFKAAIDHVRAEAAAGKKCKVTLALVKRLYEILFAGVESKAGGELRKEIPLHRAYFHEIAPPAKIEGLLAKLIDWCESADFRGSHALHKAAKLQHSFMAIYPYTDGSGKIARLLSNLVLLQGGYQPCIIHTIDRQRYYESLKQPETALRELMLESMENALANGEKLVREAQAARARKVVR